MVDTSIWIRFLANRGLAPIQLDSLLDKDLVYAHDFVFGEMLIGDTGGRAKFLREYDLLPKAETVPHQEVLNFAQTQKLCGRGIGWIDVNLLASALAGGLQFWTADERLRVVSEEIGISFHP